MGEGTTAWDNHMDYPPSDEHQHLQVMAQRFERYPTRAGRMAISEYSRDSSSASATSDSESEYSYSTSSRSGASTPVARAAARRPRSRTRGVVRRMQEPQPRPVPAPPPPSTLDGQHTPVLWVGLPKGVVTRGQRVCWMPATFLKSKKGISKAVTNLTELTQYDLVPKTNQKWLSRGIRLEEVVLYREEFQGPAAQLSVFRDHPKMGGAPYNVNRPKNTRVGRVTLQRKHTE